MNFNAEWYDTVRKIRYSGRIVSPRGRRIKELNHRTILVDMRYPVLTARKLNYQFMGAEALWILHGRDDVFHPLMAPFSDDGRYLAGAYGPRIRDQIDYVINRLDDDRDTRQAALTIWRPNPEPSRDIPCTMSKVFSIRDDALNLHVFMRSSDVWMGLPYDVFSFTMVATWVALLYNAIAAAPVVPGVLFLTAASSHLYEEHWDKEIGSPRPQNPVPTFTSSQQLLDTLELLAASKSGDAVRWWE